MGTLDFSTQNKQDLSKSEQYVILQAGKGKSDNSSLYIKAKEFSYLEGIIWDNYREYGIKKKTKITSHDCERIINGFNEGIADLEKHNTGDSLKDTLKFNIFNPRNPLNDVQDQTNELKDLISKVNTWLSTWSNEEKFILILKNHL